MEWGLPFLRLGSPEGPRIEIVAPSFRPVAAEEVVDVCTDAATTWAPLRDRSLPQEVWITIPRTETGIGAWNERRDVVLRFVHRQGMGTVEALREVEQAWGRPLPPELPAAILAASRAGRAVPGSGGPALLAKVSGEFGTGTLLPPLSRREIEAMAAAAVGDVAAGAPSLEVPASPVDRARFLLELGAIAWQNWARERLRSVQSSGAVRVLGILAGVHLLLQGEGRNAVEVAGVRIIPANTETTIGIWLQVLEWDRGIPPEVLRWYYPDGRYDSSTATVDRPYWTPEDVLAAGDPHLCAAVASSLLDEARRNARFVPSGSFVLVLPEEVPLRRWDVHAMRLAVDSSGMWVGLETRDGKVPLSMRWEPGKPLSPMLVDRLVAPLMDAVLAAVWHDLRVAGEAAFPRRERRGVSTGSGGVQARERGLPEDARGPRTRLLPSPMRFAIEGHREWGEAEERKRILRRAHGVRGHIRQLHAGWKRSTQAEEAARSYGIVLPEGYTFVRPHVRGGEKAEEVPVIHTKGLTTIITLLRSGGRSG